MDNKISIYSDGGSRGNPGPAAFAFVVIKEEKIIYKQSKYIGRTTNNVAEYNGVKEASIWLKENANKIKNQKVTFYLDSQLVVRQLMGDYKIRDQKLIPLATEIKQLNLKSGLDIEYVFVKREKNKIADRLLNEKLDEVQNKN